MSTLMTRLLLLAAGLAFLAVPLFISGSFFKFIDLAPTFIINLFGSSNKLFFFLL